MMVLACGQYNGNYMLVALGYSISSLRLTRAPVCVVICDVTDVKPMTDVTLLTSRSNFGARSISRLVITSCLT